ncbi:MAG: PAS domain-containing protein [Desulfobacter sp.]|nr:PAS domain-containing protein [Desulfobacter sp.]MDD9303493.1 PAS domain-containing protein [Desulfobacter sp.]
MSQREDELLSKPFLEFIHPDDVTPTQRAVDEELKAGKRVLNFENRYICKDGSYRWFRWVSHPQPKKGVTYAIAHDVTELKQSVNELKESHQRFLTVLDAIDAHIYVADTDTYEILFMNSKMQKDFGSDFTGKLCWRSFRDGNGPCPHCTNNRLVDSNGAPRGIVTWQGENPLTGKWYINHDRAIKWVDGRIARLQIAMDITLYKQTEEELRQAHKMEAVGTLAGGIAHDFNNILGIILGNIELALEDIPEQHTARSNLDEVKTASLRARNVVQQLLSFSRKSTQQRAPLKLVSVIEESMKLLRASIPSNIDIKIDIQDAHSFIKADSTQIQQILINLCTNAAHAMEDKGGVLKLVLKKKKVDESLESFNNKIPVGSYMHLTISDTGKGIPPNIMDKIFDPYFTTKDVGKGNCSRDSDEP